MKGYLFLNEEMDWEAAFSFRKNQYVDNGWYVAAEVSDLRELISELEKAGFDDEYIDLFIERVLSHDEYHILKENCYEDMSIR